MNMDPRYFELPEDRKPTRRQLSRKIRNQLELLQRGPDPFDEDPGLFSLQDKVAWAERLLIDPETMQALRLWKHQKQELRDRDMKKAFQTGRGTGKTTDIMVDVLHTGLTTERREYLVGTAQGVHLDRIIMDIDKQLDALPYLRERVGWRKTEDGYTYLAFVTGTIVHFRSGHPFGSAFRSLHVDGIWVDEAALLHQKAWKALLGCLNTGGFIKVYSTPNGDRTSHYYRFTKSRGWKLYLWPSWIAPTWTDAEAENKADFHGGKNSEGWKHEVAGEHGEPTMPAFDQEAVQYALREIEHYTLLHLDGTDLSDLKGEGEDAIRARLQELLNLPVRSGVFSFGADHGFSSDPAEFILDEIVDGVNLPFIRIHLEHVSYPIQAELVALLDDTYDIHVLGQDKGENGLGVYQNLTEGSRYRRHRFADRLYPFAFGSKLLVGYEKDKDGRDDYRKPIEKYAKEYATALINQSLRKGRQLLPSSDSLQEDQFVSQTCSVTGSGRLTYSKGNDHIADARRFMRLAQWAHDEAPAERGMRTEKSASVPFACTEGSFV